MTQQLELFLPDRFDTLQRRAPTQLDSIVVPVADAINHIKAVHRDAVAAGRGAFLILRGDSGSGKSTFLSTLNLFVESVEVLAVARSATIESSLRHAPSTVKTLRVIIIEGREALRDVAPADLEANVHEINAFLRTRAGENTLVVWPANADDLATLLVTTAQRVGADALLGVGDPSYRFRGPPRAQFLDIATRTIATLNQGASLADLGVTQDRAEELVQLAPTIGRFLGLLRKDLLENQRAVEHLLEKEQCNLWIVVSAANDPEGDVAALTRGALWTADIDALISATNANIVKELKKHPEKLGILASVLRARIVHLPAVAALSVAREYADPGLSSAMTAASISRSRQNDALTRLADSDLGQALAGRARGTRSRGPGPGQATQDDFKKLAGIASTKDGLLNQALGRALKANGSISAFVTEKDLGGGLTRYTDLVCDTANFGTLRLELMWRAKTGRADIANYSLTKLYNYGRAIGFL